MMQRISPFGAAGLLAIVGLNIWLLGVIAIEITSGNPLAIEKVEWQSSFSTSVGGATSRKPIEAYKQILMRPIFFKSREPFVAALAPPASASMLPPPQPMIMDPGLVLGGIMIKKDVKKAYVFSRANVEGAWLGEGDSFMGWKVKLIGKIDAKLEQQGRTIELQIFPKD